VADTLIQAAQPWAPETRKQKTTGPHVVNRWQTCACVCMRVCVCVRMHVLCLLSMASWAYKISWVTPHRNRTRITSETFTPMPYARSSWIPSRSQLRQAEWRRVGSSSVQRAKPALGPITMIPLPSAYHHHHYHHLGFAYVAHQPGASKQGTQIRSMGEEAHSATKEFEVLILAVGAAHQSLVTARSSDTSAIMGIEFQAIGSH
jgi:hypothetical protein